MYIAPIRYEQVSSRSTDSKSSKTIPQGFLKQTDRVSFQRLIPNSAKIKLAVFDIDETLKHWNDAIDEKTAQKLRNKLFKYLKENKIQTVYASDRGYDKIISLVDDGTLMKPDWIVGNNGGYIYKNVNGKFVENKEWHKISTKDFDKTKTKEILIKIANEAENMFSPEEWAKFPPEIMPTTQMEFYRSKMTEYVGHESPTSIRLALAPGVYEKLINKIANELQKNNIKAGYTLFHYEKPLISAKGLEAYFSPEASKIIENHYIPRMYPDGCGDSLLISATDKGMATEYIRKQLGLKKGEIFAAGDGENDFSNTNKGYHFALFSNAVEGLRKMISELSHPKNIWETDKPGVEGILDVLV